MKIRDIFERDPTRKISRVVKVDELEGASVGPEVVEYVVTEQIRGILQNCIDQFLDTRADRVDNVCAWISGFFGSGKSHLSKMLGYILSNREVQLDDGSIIQAANYFAEKHGFQGTAVLSRQLKTKVLFLNMLTFDRAIHEDLSRFVYRSLLKNLGLSEILWVAEIEQAFKDEGLWESFNTIIKKETGEDWDAIREKDHEVGPALILALTKLKPHLYPDHATAREAVEDQKREFILGPERLARRLVQDAIQLDETEGRVVLVLDEIGLWLRSVRESGLTELNSFAEQLERLGHGKVWLFVTAQEALEVVAPEVGGIRDQLGWLQDRFQLKYQLDPKNIPTVVNNRLLGKNRSSRAYKELKKLYDKHGGQLSLATSISDPMRDEGEFSSYDFDELSRVYPFLPYHIPLMIQIFMVLRSKGRKMGQEARVAGRERAALSVAQSILIELDRLCYEVGRLVTFDLLYDSIDNVLKVVSSSENSVIREHIMKLGDVDGLQVSSVAKTLFLLQQIEEWVPCTLNNIAAVLYPNLGLDPRVHLERVDKCLESIKDDGWIKLEEGKYRFLSEVEQNFEKDVNEEIYRPKLERQIKDRVVEIVNESLRTLRRYNHKKIKIFDVLTVIDEEQTSRKGDLKLNVYTPIWARSRDNPVDDVNYMCLADEESVFWICPADDDFYDKLRRLLAIENVFGEWMRRAKTPQMMAEIEPYRNEISELKEDLPRQLGSLLRNGSIFYYGEREDLSGTSTIEIISQKWLSILTEQLFPRFDDGAVNIPKDSLIENILRWRGGSLPSVYRDLKLVDQQNNILPTGPVAHPILSEIKKRGELSGKELEEHFSGRPYGWPERVIRLTLATMYKNGSIQVEPANDNSFTARRNFRSAKFSEGILVSQKERIEARRIIAETFGVNAGVTTELISNSLMVQGEEKINSIRKLTSTDGYYRLPFRDDIEKLNATLILLVNQPSHPHRVKAVLVPEVVDVLENRLPLLKNIQDFIQNNRLSLYLLMRRFAVKPLNDLCIYDLNIKDSAKVFRDKLISKTLLDDWESIYDQYRKFKDSYIGEYENAHESCQVEVDTAIDDLKDWSSEKHIKDEEVAKEILQLENYGCNAGKTGRYLDEEYQCSTCIRFLSTLHKDYGLVRPKLNEIKIKLFTQFQENGNGYKQRINVNPTIESSSDLQITLDELREFVSYWLAKSKKIRFKIEGEAESE